MVVDRLEKAFSFFSRQRLGVVVPFVADGLVLIGGPVRTPIRHVPEHGTATGLSKVIRTIK